MGFPGGSEGKESACNTGDLGSVPGIGRSSGGGQGNPLQYSGLENSMNCIAHGVTKSWIWLSNFHSLAPGKKSYNKPRQHIKKQRHYFADKVLSSQSYGFSSSHVWMWELDYKDSWAMKNWCFWTVVLEKTLESPLDCKEIKPVNPKGISSAYLLEELILKL